MTPKPDPIRVVFDCMVFLQAAGRPQSPARACAELVEAGRLTLCLDQSCLDEIRGVLSRPALRIKFPDLDPTWADGFIAKLGSLCHFHRDVSQVFEYPRDPKDEKYINLSHAAQAAYLVSRDNDLLDMMRPTTPEAVGFRARFPDLKIVTPEELLAIIRTEPAGPV